MKFLIGIWGGMFLLIIFSCKKTDGLCDVKNARSDEELIKDSIYYYYHLYSLWSDRVPDYDDLAVFADSFMNDQDVLTALKRYSPYYAAYGGPLDRFSYLVDQASSIEDGDAQEGFGIYLSPGVVTDTEARLVIYLVEGGSPAASVGIHRGDQVIAVNGSDNFSIPVIKNHDGKYVFEDESIYAHVLSNMLGALNGTSLKLKVKHEDDTESEYNLLRGSYAINPLLKDTVFHFSDKNIGYFALSSFEKIDQSNVNYFYYEEMFSSFERARVYDLIVDMRYNTGGYISAAQYLANKIINEKGNGRLMFKYELNSYLTQLKEKGDARFADVLFDRNNQLEINTVYFLVTDITASASELLISVLKPYMNVRIIAENSHTYGKPVGFFEQKILGKTSLWSASFKLVNADGYTDYWNGLSADQQGVVDYIFKDFGDPQENMIAAALNEAKPGISSLSSHGAGGRVLKRTNIKLGTVNSVPQKHLLK